MLPVLFAQSTIMQYPLGILLFIVSLFLILLILVQRGRGGGLTGALGGMGGQSAFGSKAGDVFTKITVGTAIVWIVLCLGIIAMYDMGGFEPTRGRGRGTVQRGRDADKVLRSPANDAAGDAADTASEPSETSVPGGEGATSESTSDATDEDAGTTPE